MEKGYDIFLTWKDIELIGELFNTCMERLEKEHSEYRDWGMPTEVLSKEVFKEFTKIKSNEEVLKELNKIKSNEQHQFTSL